jgi:DNA-binding beta-propeller fold protein YncE
MLNIPGTLVDILADPVRNRYYILRQDNNTVLVFDASNNTQITTLSTNNVPTSMAITLDNNLLLVGHSKSQTIAVFDLNSLQAQPYIQTSPDGLGNEVRSIAVSSQRILVTAIDYKITGHVLWVDLNSRQANRFATLGDWENKISTDAVVVASPDQSKIMVAGSDGNVFLYDAGVVTWRATIFSTRSWFRWRPWTRPRAAPLVSRLSTGTRHGRSRRIAPAPV